MNKRLDKTKLNIGTYILQPYARSEAHIKDLVDSGIDFVIGMDYDVPTLNLFKKYGIGAVVSGVVPGWWGGDGNAELGDGKYSIELASSDGVLIIAE